MCVAQDRCFVGWAVRDRGCPFALPLDRVAEKLDLFGLLCQEGCCTLLDGGRLVLQSCVFVATGSFLRANVYR